MNLFRMKNPVWLCVPLLLVSSLSLADSRLSQIVSMRAELETESKDVDAEVRELQGEHDLWLQKKLELEGALQKEQLRKAQLRAKMELVQQGIIKQDKQSPELKRDLKVALEDVEVWLKSSLPYRRKPRLEALAKIRQSLNEDKKSAESLAGDLWSLLDNELKMSGENEYRITEIETDRGLEKGEMVRLGSMALFAKMPGTRYLQAQRKGGGWVMAQIESDQTRSEIDRLIDNLKNKRKAGLYDLPVGGEAQ